LKLVVILLIDFLTCRSCGALSIAERSASLTKFIAFDGLVKLEIILFIIVALLSHARLTVLISLAEILVVIHDLAAAVIVDVD